MYRYVIFDFDGTIADSGEMVNRVFTGLCEKYNVSGITSRDIKHRKELPFTKQLKLLLTVSRFKAEFQRAYYENVGFLKAFDQMLELLPQLQGADYRLAILTSNNRDNISHFFDLNHIELDLEILSAKGFFGKHRCLNRFMEEHGCEAKDILYIGDEARDIMACNRAGVDIAFVKWGFDGDEDVSVLKPRYTVSSVQELKNLLLSS